MSRGCTQVQRRGVAHGAFDILARLATLTRYLPTQHGYLQLADMLLAPQCKTGNCIAQSCAPRTSNSVIS